MDEFSDRKFKIGDTVGIFDSRCPPGGPRKPRGRWKIVSFYPGKRRAGLWRCDEFGATGTVAEWGTDKVYTSACIADLVLLEGG